MNDNFGTFFEELFKELGVDTMYKGAGYADPTETPPPSLMIRDYEILSEPAGKGIAGVLEGAVLEALAQHAPQLVPRPPKNSA